MKIISIYLGGLLITKHFIKKFQSQDKDEHFSAFFELMLHEMIFQLGFKPSVHPELNNTNAKPDFALTDKNSKLSFLEALVDLWEG